MMQWLVDEAVDVVRGREIWRFCCTVRHRQRHTVPRSMADWLIKSKCIPVLVYGFEVFPLTKFDLKSLDFPVNRFFMKLFNTSSIQMVNECQVYFGFDLPSVIIGRQSKKFMSINATYSVS